MKKNNTLMVSLVCSISRLGIRLMQAPEQDRANAGMQMKHMLCEKQ